MDRFPQRYRAGLNTAILRAGFGLMRQCPLCSRLYDDDAAFCPLDGRVLLLPDPMLGRVIGERYRVDAFLGGGAQSRVYRATHLHLQRPAAVKVIRGDFAAGDEAVERFRREALAVARLKHPNIVTVHDSGIDPEVGAYIVMEFLEGRPLRSEMVRHGRHTVDEAVAIMRQLCDGVSAAHGAGVVHRDLKPDNVLLEMRGDGARTAKILDFGVAKLRPPPTGETLAADEATDPHLSASMAGLGTPAYMSPEQCAGNALDFRSDIYSLGCMFFELLVGKPPFMADGGATILHKHMDEPAPRPSDLVPGLSADVDRVVLTMLAKRADDRYQTADEVGASIERLGSSRPSSGALSAAAAARAGRRAVDRADRNNLPQQVTTFIGREREMASVRSALTTTRLVTITGPGGSGKTRLALEVAAGLLDEFPDGVWHVPLSALADPELVPRAVASGLGIQEAARPSASVLLDFLQFKRLLLVLDNCEHLVAACADTTDAILRACPFVRVLATSQEPLAILGEAALTLPPLSLPDSGQRLGPVDLGRFESVRLFVDRARLANAAFALTRENAPAVASVCQRLDGIPLAIELAAARVKVLAVDQIDERLDDRFRLLSAGNRTAEPRQRTLLAAIDWSYDLLVGPARTVFDRLSVFAGGFDLEAAEDVCAAGDVRPDDVLYLLSNLVDKSLVLVEERGGSSRYRLLQTIRQYGAERLRITGEAAAARDRHRAHYLRFAERAERELRSPEQDVWLSRLELEHDNLRAALEWSKWNAGDSDAYLRLAGALWEFWLVRGHEREGRDWLESALDLGSTDPVAARAKALHGAGALARLCGDYGRAIDRLAEGLAMGRMLGDASRIAGALNHLGIVRQWQGEYGEARRLLEEGLEVARAAGDPWETAPALKNLGVIAHIGGDHDRAVLRYEESLRISRSIDAAWEIATTLNNLAVVLASRGEFGRASELFTEDLQIYRRLGDRRGIAMALNNLGELAQNQGEYGRAADLLSESLLLNVEAGNKRSIAYGLECFVSLLAARGDADRALRLAAAAGMLREEIGSPLSNTEREDLDRAIARARGALDDDAALARWVEGTNMTLEQAVDAALGAAVARFGA